MFNNFETVRNTQNMSMNHDYETGVALSDSVNKTCVKRPLAENMISGWQKNLSISETMSPRYKVTMGRYQEVMVALS